MSTHAGRARSRPLRVPSRRSWSRTQNPDPGQTDRHRRHLQQQVVNSGYLQRGVRRRVAISSVSGSSLFRLRASNIHTSQSGAEGAVSIGKHMGERREKGNGSWLNRDMMGSIAEAGAAWLWVWDISAGCASSFAPTRVVVGGRCVFMERGVRGGRREGGTEDSMPCSSAVGILPSGIFKRLVCVCWLHCILPARNGRSCR